MAGHVLSPGHGLVQCSVASKTGRDHGRVVGNHFRTKPSSVRGVVQLEQEPGVEQGEV
jgi:hypothetical protein